MTLSSNIIKRTKPPESRTSNSILKCLILPQYKDMGLIISVRLFRGSAGIGGGGGGAAYAGGAG